MRSRSSERVTPIARSISTASHSPAHLRSTRAARTHRRAVPRRRRSGPGDGQRVGVLLVHGFTGSPASMVPWGEHLAAQGYAVVVPRLPGHGTTWQELNRTALGRLVRRGRARLREAARRAATRSSSAGSRWAAPWRCGWPPTAAGGGRPGAGQPRGRRPTARTCSLLPVLKHLVPSFPGIANDIKKPGVEEHGYTKTPLRAAHSMMHGLEGRCARTSPKVTQPLLLFRSTEDHVVDPSSRRGDPGARVLARPRPSGCSRTATTWPRSTTTPRASSRSPPSSSDE